MSTTIIRATHRDRPFIIDQRTVENDHLSWAARGLLIYLLSRTDGWTLQVEELCDCGDLGRDGIYNLLHELREAGYVTYEQERDENGRIVERGRHRNAQELCAGCEARAHPGR